MQSSIEEIRWRALELALIWRARAGGLWHIPTIGLNTKRGASFAVALRPDRVRFIERTADPSTIDPPIEPGDIIACWRSHPVIDIVLYGTDERLVFIQASLQSYRDHSAKLSDLFTHKMGRVAGL